MIIASAIAAVVPISVFLLIIWRIDRFDKEPFYLVLLNHLWGAIGAIIFTFLGSTFISLVLSFLVQNLSLQSHIETIVVAPVVEEITKGIFLLLMINLKSFDNITDGIVYGGAIGLGFGMTENFFYFVTFGTDLPSWVSLVVIRTLFSAVMHCVATATLGAFLAYAKFKNIYSKVGFFILGLATAMFIHAFWNLTVSFQSTALFGFLFMLVNIIAFFVMFFLAINNEKKIIYRELLEEANAGLIPFEHLQIINSKVRNYQGWINENIRNDYVKAVITLAFRKVQLRNSLYNNREVYQREVDYYRGYVFQLLTNNVMY